MDYRQLAPILGAPVGGEPPSLYELGAQVGEVMDAYQASHYGLATRRLPILISEALLAARTYTGQERAAANRSLALAYQAAAQVLGKVGEYELAWIAADRGLGAAHNSDDEAVTASLLRSVAHCLMATGRFSEALQLVEEATNHLTPAPGEAASDLLSAHGSLFLTGAMAAARLGDRATVRALLCQAAGSARRLGRDANHLWTAFGPTNVALHQIATAGELGDGQFVAEMGQRVDTSALPMERRVRHALEVARALSTHNRVDEALAMLLDAEHEAPEQVRHHYLSREPVLGWISATRGRPARNIVDLARRLRVV